MNALNYLIEQAAELSAHWSAQYTRPTYRVVISGLAGGLFAESDACLTFMEAIYQAVERAKAINRPISNEVANKPANS